MTTEQLIKEIRSMGLIKTSDGRKLEDCSLKELKKIYEGRKAEIYKAWSV